MKATIWSTDMIVDSFPGPGGRVDAQARVWEGVTEHGVEFVAYIPCVQVRRDADNSMFESELKEHKIVEPATQRAIDLRHT